MREEPEVVEVPEVPAVREVRAAPEVPGVQGGRAVPTLRGERRLPLPGAPLLLVRDHLGVHCFAPGKGESKLEIG